MPAGVTDRDADCWEALLAIADVAGGAWPELARISAVTLVTDAKAATPSLGVRLLADLRHVFGDRPAMHTTGILTELIALEESPWGDLKGKPLDARRLARFLEAYGVHRTQVRVGERSAKGYLAEHLHDPFERYLPPLGLPAIAKVTRVTTVTEPAAPGEEAFE